MDTGLTPKSVGKNRLRLIYDAKDLKCKVVLNGVQSSYTSTTADCQISQICVGGGATAANNAVNTIFSNLVKWTTILSEGEILADNNGVLIESNLDGFFPLESVELSYRNEGINNNHYLETVTTTLTIDTKTDNNFTDTEKSKLANSISGTFTTNDGKTITVVGGMITSIV